ncbi:MAG: glycosyl hydrolase family 65 protein [Acidimicrobiia bacterium]
MTSPWLLELEGFDPSSQGHREVLCTLGNGVFATRGALTEVSANDVHYPGTYAAGCFNRLVSQVEGRAVEHESMVNLPNWLPMTFRPAGGAWLDVRRDEVVDLAVALDLEGGSLTRTMRVRDGDGRQSTIRERRFVSMASPHLGALEWSIVPENWEGEIIIFSSLDGGVKNRNVAAERALAGRHLEVVGRGASDAETVWIEVETVQSHVRVAEAARTRIAAGLEDLMSRCVIQEDERVGHELRVVARRGLPITVEKVVSLYTSRDHAISTSLLAETGEVSAAPGFGVLLADHEQAWRNLWHRCRLELATSEHDTERVLNLHIFHVLQTLSPHVADLDVGVPARGLHGEAYRGHIFWDELFAFPFLNLRLPSLTRELLMYRHRRLPAARRLAAEVGHQGAMYPWQSGSDGREETPTEFFNPRSGRWMPDNSRRQRHVNLAIGHNIWQYYEVTADHEFLASYGAEMIVEIARLLANTTTFDDVDGRYHMRGVMGPDEFHDGYPDSPGRGIDDNAYNNVMTAWLLRRALDAQRVLDQRHRHELRDRLRLDASELDDWDRISRRLHVPFLDSGMLEQFVGYGQLDVLDWPAYRARYGDIGRLDLILESEGDSTNRYQASKQADVLMLFFLFSSEELVDLFAHLGYDFDPATIPDTVDHYLARTSNGSTLSQVVHAWVLSRSHRERSWPIFRQALASDIADVQGGTTREGIHLGAMAGTVDIVQRCYMGVEARDDVLWFNPRLPDEVQGLEISVQYRGHWIEASVIDGVLTVRSRPAAAAALKIGLIHEVVDLRAGDAVERRLA